MDELYDKLKYSSDRMKIAYKRKKKMITLAKNVYEYYENLFLQRSLEEEEERGRRCHELDTVEKLRH